MEFFYACGDRSGLVKASSAINAARKIIGKRANHFYGDPRIEYAIYQGEFRDSDDFEQCSIKLASENQTPLFHKFIWSALSVWMVFCVINLGTLLYDVDMFRNLVFKTVGYQSPPQMKPSADITQTVAYKKE